jgi:hypothetical protein
MRGVVDIPPLLNEMITRSPHGPKIAYELAKEAWDPEGAGIIWELEKMADDPIRQAQAFGAIEYAVAVQQKQQGGQQVHRATQAPRPIRPVSGGGAAPRQDLQSLAGSDDVGEYVRARRSQMRDQA